jgi:FRG domain
MTTSASNAHPWNEPIKWIAPDPGSYRRIERPVMKLWQYVQLACDGYARRIPGSPPRYTLFRGQRKPWRLCPKIARRDLIRQEKGLEESSLREFQRLCPLLVSQRTPSDLESLCLAQHHGMATRLLDWTDNALAALWFAIHEIDYSQNQPAVVWEMRLWGDEKESVTKSDDSNPFAVDTTKVVCPDHSNERIRAQSGWFTLHHLDEDTGHFPPLEEQSEYLADAEGHNCRLSRIDIDPRGGFQTLRVELEDCGISAASIYPDLSGLCERITETMSLPIRLKYRI